MSEFLNNPVLTGTIILDFLGFVGAGMKCHQTNVGNKWWTVFLMFFIGFFWIFTTDLAFLLTGDTTLTPFLYLFIRGLFVFPIWFTLFSIKQL